MDKIVVESIIKENKGKVFYMYIGEELRKIELSDVSTKPVAVVSGNTSLGVRLKYCKELKCRDKYIECVLEEGRYMKVKTNLDTEYKLEKIVEEVKYCIPYKSINYIEIIKEIKV